MSHLFSKKVFQLTDMPFARNLVTDPKYGFLKQLGLSAENPGLYDGRWGGSGKVSFIG